MKNTSKELLIYHNQRAGYLVEKLSGMGFGEFLRTRPFEPFGMRDTAFRGAIAQDRAFRLLLSAETGAAV